MGVGDRCGVPLACAALCVEAQCAAHAFMHAALSNTMCCRRRASRCPTNCIPLPSPTLLARAQVFKYSETLERQFDAKYLVASGLLGDDFPGNKFAAGNGEAAMPAARRSLIAVAQGAAPSRYPVFSTAGAAMPM